jgi:hypothetical protein
MDPVHAAHQEVAAAASALASSDAGASVFDAQTMADFQRLREQQVALFARHMHLETSFRNVEPLHEFERPAFCDHFPAAFVEKDSEIQRIAGQMNEIQGLL